MSAPQVTIITPTYKHESFIGECLESVLSQTFGDWEQIVVDDCSPDGTLDVVGRYRDPRILLIRKSVRGGPEGLHESYNLALRAARGALIAVLEGDDFWPADKLSVQVPFHQRPNVVMSWGRYIIQNGGRQALIRRRSLGPIVFPDTSYLLIRNIIPAVTVMASRQALEQIGGFWQPAGAVFVDHPTWLKLSQLGDILYIPRFLGFYRMHGSQISRNHAEQMCFFSHDYVDAFIQSLAPLERRKLDLNAIAAAKSLNQATHEFGQRNYGRFISHLARSFLKGDIRTKYTAVQLFSRACLGGRNWAE
jgi:glycosyltransferase involved in cell wall biosynthesis